MQTSRILLNAAYFVFGIALGARGAIDRDFVASDGRLARGWITWQVAAGTIFAAFVVVLVISMTRAGSEAGAHTGALQCRRTWGFGPGYSGSLNDGLSKTVHSQKVAGRPTLAPNPMATSILRLFSFAFAGVLSGAAASNEGGFDPDFSVPQNKALFHIFLLAGQSNMAGRGEIGPEDLVPIPHVLALGRDGAWHAAVDPIHWDKPVAGVGLARSFAVAYLADHPGVTIGFVPAACGGSPIAVWRPGEFYAGTNSHPYDDAIARTRIAVQHGTLKGILWHQGEADGHPGKSEVYAAALTELIARFRRELEAPGIPFVIGQVGNFDAAPWGGHTRQVYAAQKEVAASTPRTAFVSSEGLASKPDNIHFDTESLRELGRRYYAAFRKLERSD